ncbi:hypothetical protein Tco_0111945 [Tanacetum coccineum]
MVRLAKGGGGGDDDETGEADIGWRDDVGLGGVWRWCRLLEMTAMVGVVTVVGQDGAAEVMMIWQRVVVDEWLSWMAATAGRR